MRAMLQPDVEYRIAHHEDLNWEPQLEVVEVGAGVVFEEDGVRIDRGRDRSPARRADLGYRIEHDGKAVVHRGRHRAVRRSRRAVRGRRRLRADGVARRPRAAWCRCSASVDTIDYHSTVVQAAQTAARGGVRTLVFTHQIPTPGPGSADEWVAIAREHFGGEILFGTDLLTISA